MTTSIRTRAQEFRDQLASRVMVADGAMGTMLYAQGVFINRCFDELNLSSPDLVREVHQEYVKAGAEILETNTFGANSQASGRVRFADKVHAINQAGVRIAREAAATRRSSRAPSVRWACARTARVRLHCRSARHFPRTDRCLGRSRRRSADPRNLPRPRRTPRGDVGRARSGGRRNCRSSRR